MFTTNRDISLPIANNGPTHQQNGRIKLMRREPAKKSGQFHGGAIWMLSAQPIPSKRLALDFLPDLLV